MSQNPKPDPITEFFDLEAASAPPGMYQTFQCRTSLKTTCLQGDSAYHFDDDASVYAPLTFQQPSE